MIVIYILLFILGAFHASISIDQSINFLDEGFNFEATQRILNGDVPYRDFYFFATPLFFYISALWVKVSHVPVDVLRYFGTIISGLHSILIFHITLRLTRNNRIALIAWILSLALGLNAGRLLYHYSWFAVTMALGVLALFIHFEQSKKQIYMFLAGIMVALTTLTKQTVGLYTLIGLTGYWIVSIAFYKESILSLIRKLVIICLGISIPSIIFLGYIVWQGALQDFLTNTIINPLTLYTAAHVPPPTLEELYTSLRPLNMTTLYPVVYYFEVFVILAFVAYVAMKRSRIPRMHLIIGIFFLAQFVQTTERMSMLISQSLVGFALILLAAIVSEATSYFSTTSLKKLLTQTILLSIVLLEVTTYLKISFFADQTVPLTGITAYKVTSEIYNRYSPMYVKIKQITRYEDTIFVYPHTPMWYIMLDKNNPTKASLMITGHLSPSMEQEVIQQLESKQTKFVLYNEPFIIDGQYFADLYQDLDSYIHKQYVPIYVFDERGILMQRVTGVDIEEVSLYN